MADRFLHGIELIEIEDGGRTVRTVKSSVIGLVGTAPQASTARTATLTLGQGEASLTFTAKVPGALGNTLRVQLRAQATPEAPLAVRLDTRTPGSTLIDVTLATNAQGERISTAAEVAQALMADSSVAARVTVTAGGEGTGVVAATLGSRGLDGGMDEPFPMNVPVLVNNRRLAAHLGDAGTLPRHCGPSRIRPHPLSMWCASRKGQHWMRRSMPSSAALIRRLGSWLASRRCRKPARK